MNVEDLLGLRKIVGQQLRRIESLGRSQPAEPARRHAGYEANGSVPATELLLLSPEQRNKGLSDLAETNDAEPIRTNAVFSDAVVLFCLL